MANSHYYIGGGDCLKNKLGITDKDELAQIETDVAAAKITGLKENPLPGIIDYPYYKEIHRTIFEDVYDWAGKERDIPTEKDGFKFELEHRIQSTAEKLFEQLSSENNLKNLDRSDFIERAAHYFEEFNFVHPFPEGNGRAQRVLFDQIAREAGKEFDWDLTTKDQVIEAVIFASGGHYSKLETVFNQTLIELDRSIEVNKTPELVLTVTDPIGKTEYTKALAALSEKASELSIPLRQDADKQIHAMQVKAEVLDRKIQNHIDIKPKSNMLSSTSAGVMLDDWNHNKKVLIAERDGLLRYIENVKSGDIHKQTEAAITKKAEALAKISLPIESKLVKEFKADRTIYRLSKKLNELNATINREQRDPENSKILSRSLKEKSHILSKLKNNKTLDSRITLESKESLSAQAKDTSLMLSRVNALSLGRGR